MIIATNWNIFWWSKHFPPLGGSWHPITILGGGNLWGRRLDRIPKEHPHQGTTCKVAIAWLFKMYKLWMPLNKYIIDIWYLQSCDNGDLRRVSSPPCPQCPAIHLLICATQAYQPLKVLSRTSMKISLLSLTSQIFSHCLVDATLIQSHFQVDATSWQRHLLAMDQGCLAQSQATGDSVLHGAHYHH